MRPEEEIRLEIAALAALAEIDEEANIAAGAHDALCWALGWAEEPISESLTRE